MTGTTSLTLQDGSLLVHSERCLEAEVGGQVVMMDTDRGFCYGLDATGSFIWEQLKTPTTLASLVQLCSEQFDAPAEQIESDIKDLLNELLEKQLITAHRPA
jgi:hypothetical protein